MHSNTNTPLAHRSDGAQRRPADVARASSPCDATQSRPLEFGICRLGFIWDLDIGIWNFHLPETALVSK